MKKLFTLWALSFALLASAQQANLCFKPVVSKKYNVSFVSNMDIVQSMGGMDVKVKANSEGNAGMLIEKVAPNGDVTILTEWKNMKVTSSAMGNDTVIEYKDMKLKFRTVYSNVGKILKSERVDSAKIAGLELVDQMMKGLKFPYYTCNAVKVNDSWTVENNESLAPGSAGNPFEMNVKTTENVTYLGTESKNGVTYNKLKVSGPMKIDGKGSQMGMDMSIDGTGITDGFALIDTQTGFPAYVESKMGMDMNIAVTGAQSMAIPMTQNGTNIYTFTEVK